MDATLLKIYWLIVIITNFDAIPTLRYIVTKPYGIQYYKNLAMVTLANGLLILADIWRIDLLLTGLLFVLIRIT